MRWFYISYKQVKHEYSLLRAYAVICDKFNITVKWDYLLAQNQGKLSSVCLQRFSSIFESTILAGVLQCNGGNLEEAEDFKHVFVVYSVLESK